MTYYLDASFLVALLTSEATNSRADDFMRACTSAVIVSNFAAAEFASAISRRVRIEQTARTEASLILSAFDSWTTQMADRIGCGSVDIAVAATFLRRLDLPLRTPDAIHIAISQRVGATLVTFDRQMAASAEALGVPVATP